MSTRTVTRRQLVLAQGTSDGAILEAAIEMEQRSAFAYSTLADSGKLGRLEAPARLFARQEEDHAGALIRALRQRGGSPPAKPGSVADVSGLGEAAAGSRSRIMAFAVELETMAIAKYYEALAKLEAPELLSMAASIMANQAQHLVVLRQALGENPAPEAFVTAGARGLQ